VLQGGYAGGHDRVAFLEHLLDLLDVLLQPVDLAFDPPETALDLPAFHR
jgi:hypothetical protein